MHIKLCEPKYKRVLGRSILHSKDRVSNRHQVPDFYALCSWKE